MGMGGDRLPDSLAVARILLCPMRHHSELLFADGVFDRRSHPAEEVYVTGTFDGWGKSQQLEKVGDVFEKKVKLLDPADKIFYKVCNTLHSFLIPPLPAHSELVFRVVACFPDF
jgi:hypothetical protein